MTDDRRIEQEDHDLMRRMAARDVNALDAFYDKYRGLAFSLVLRIVGNRADAEDVTMDVFWQVWQDAPRYDPQRGTARAWLMMRAKTRAIDRLRSIRRREKTFVMPVDEGRTGAEGASPESPAIAAEGRGVVEGALARLPEAQRRVIQLAFFEGLTQSEIAARLGEPLGTVKTRARLGLERLRGALGEAERSNAKRERV